MNSETYSRVIGEWCEHTGMTPWAPGTDMHIELENATVGLIYDEENSPQVLLVFVDLGEFDFPDFHKRMLELNMSLSWPDGGYFALHPEAGSLAYRASIELTPATPGAELPGRLASLVFAARTRLMQ